jgi:hypothetical protein
MDNQIQATLDLLVGKIHAKEEEANKLKKLVNELSVEAGMDVPYSDIHESADGTTNIRSDLFYGQVLVTATRKYLEMRKASKKGAASIAEIYNALKRGGYKFDTKDEENAKNTVRVSLRKNSSIFHKLPNGEYGLLAWYPNAKIVADDEEQKDEKPKKGTAKPEKEEKTAFVSNEMIRTAVFATTGNFKGADIEATLKRTHSSLDLRAGSLAQEIFNLKKKGLIREVSARAGSTGATYCKS